MSIQAVGLKAYTSALNNFKQAESTSKASTVSAQDAGVKEFSSVLKDSLGKVNSMQQERSKMVMAFASGESQNVHELMISMQKAGLAMNMTAAVRNKAMEAYKELTRIQF